MSGSWTWRYLDGEGAPAPAGDAALTESSEFPSQGDAESWLGTQWRSLAEAGVEAVTLQCDGEAVYGSMSLRSAE